MTQILKDGIAEWRNGGKSPPILKDGIAERRNDGKYPEVLKDGMTENAQNPKRRNDGKSPNIVVVKNLLSFGFLLPILA